MKIAIDTVKLENGVIEITSHDAYNEEVEYKTTFNTKTQVHLKYFVKWIHKIPEAKASKTYGEALINITGATVTINGMYVETKDL